MTTSQTYDVIVVGAGVEGSATAHNLALSKYRTLLIDQYPLPHTRGSSHGKSRTIRRCYNKEVYCNMMLKAYEMWEQLEREEGVDLIINAGLLSVEAPPTTELNNIADSMETNKQPYEWLDAGSLVQRFPMFNLRSSYRAIFESRAGLIKADKSVASLLNQFRRHGGTIHDGEPVTGITPGNPVVVTTTKQQYTASSVVLCAGPWTSKLIAPLGLELPLEVKRVGVYYWRTRTGQFTPEGGMPSYYFPRPLPYGTELEIYGQASVEYPNYMKVCHHGGQTIDPDWRDTREALETEKDILRRMIKFVKEHFPGLEPYPSIQESCLYTMTPDDDFILDTHPKWNNIVIGAGFSGHGFKLAPVVGQILAEMATNRQPTFDTNMFKMDRFNKPEFKAKI